MLKHLTVLSFVFFAATTALAVDQFPKNPDDNLTPGALCAHADELRYPEQIKYCERDVSSSTKKGIFQKYDQLGYRTRSMNRQKFKIDHYIPLCMGGANDTKNLWPQHESVYNITDELEFVLCEKMKAGRLKQKDAINFIREAKHNLDQVNEIRRIVDGL